MIETKKDIIMNDIEKGWLIFRFVISIISIITLFPQSLKVSLTKNINLIVQSEGGYFQLISEETDGR